MSVPSLSETTSILAWILGVDHVYQPSGTELPRAEASADAGTDVLTFADTLTADQMASGDRVRVAMADGGALPDPLALGTDYFLRDFSTASAKLAATAGGSAIDLTDVGSGALVKVMRADAWSAEGLPAGVYCDGATGRIYGKPAEAGVFVVSLVARNAAGASAARELVIGVIENPFLVSGAVEIDVDITTGAIRVPAGLSAPASASEATESAAPTIVVNNIGGEAATTTTPAQAAAGSLFEAETAKPPTVLHAKQDDEFLFAVGFYKGPRLVSLPLAILNFGAKEREPEGLIVLNDGTFESVGGLDNRRYLIRVKFDPANLENVLASYVADNGTKFVALCEIEWGITYEDPPATLTTLLRTSRTFGVEIERDLIPDGAEL